MTCEDCAELIERVRKAEARLAALEAGIAPRQDVLYPARWKFGAAANYEAGVRDERARLRALLTKGGE